MDGVCYWMYGKNKQVKELLGIETASEIIREKGEVDGSKLKGNNVTFKKVYIIVIPLV